MVIILDRVLKVTLLEIKKRSFLKDLAYFLIFTVSMSILSYFLTKQLLANSSVSEIPIFILRFISYILLVICSFSLTSEFANKTDKMIFTGIFSRNEIIISKLISFICASLICFTVYEISCAVCGTFSIKLFLNSLCVFLAYSFTLGSFLLFISTITSNFLVTGIIGYVLYFDLMLALLNQALASNSVSQTSKSIIKSIPFYVANTGFLNGSYSIQNLLVMFISGIIFLTGACVIINKKEIR